ncbi:MAG: Uma2 family endonuclease [Schwartzia sp.]|nr:Uma2 family endonuclease [Schwartzia sp. (in: firmicutes)]
MKEALAYRDEPLVEKIDGQIVSMSPSPAVEHNRIAGNIYSIFRQFLKGKKRCEPFFDGVDVHLDDDNIFVPDVMIVCDRSKIRPDGIYGAPDLVVEILSPSTLTRDRGIKKTVYERAGVREYWIVDPLAKSVEVYHLREGKLELDHAYIVYPDWEWERMTEKEKAAARLSVKVSLYDSLDVDVREVFEAF